MPDQKNFRKPNMLSKPLEKKYRRRLLVAFACVVTVFGVAGCSGKDNSGQPSAGTEVKAPPNQQSAPEPVKKLEGNLASGKEIYGKYCHYCHGQKGYGDGPVGLALTPHPVDFVNDAKRMKKTDEELYKSISEGIHRQIGGEALAMPRWQDILTVQERWDVLAYIRQLESAGKK
ncbi:c-type cytochrome [bacterium]|nr:MAG: c-type cytochrome [bacterium]